MKHILFVMSGMNIGGAERCLLGLLGSIDYSKYAVDLFLLRHCGALMPYIDKRVNVLPENPKYSVYACSLADVIKNGNFGAAYGRIKAKIMAGRYVRKHNITGLNGIELEYSHKYTVKYLPKINPGTEYDLAVSFITPHYIVANNVNAKVKAAWIHTDYSYIDVDASSELKMWDAYDNIISISDSVTESFLKVFPSLKKKICLIEHVIPEKLLWLQAKEGRAEAEREMPEKDGEWRLLSIGRFCPAKNFDNIPQMCSIVRSLGVNIKWYIIGFGPDEKLINSKIQEYGMQDYVIMLGKKSNPYPYIAACDFYLQPSRFEGKAVTVCEALVMKKLVVIAEYATAKSQIKNGTDGVILPVETELFAKRLAEFIENKELQNQIRENVESTDYSCSEESLKLYSLGKECV